MNKELKELLKNKEYDFLRTHKSLGNNIILLVMGGSRSYGTNTPNSDYDMRGVALERPENIYGLEHFEQIEDKSTDTVIYSLRKFLSMAANGNPNILEMLGVREEDIIYITPAGQMLLDNKHLFLTQRVVYTIGGYANQQLRRLENALARQTTQSRREEHIKNSIDNFMYEAKSMFTTFSDSDIKVYVDDSYKEQFEKELFIDINLKHYPIRDFNAFMRQVTDIVRVYDKNEKGSRNSKKDELHLNKHAMHLIRLYLMGTEILQTGNINTYRKDDLTELMAIRNGKYMLKDGNYSDEFYKLIDELTEKFENAKANTSLPFKADMKKIEELQIQILKKYIKD